MAEIVKVDAPKLKYFENESDFQNGSKFTLCCFRPGSTDSCPDIFLKKLGEKIVISNYGHAGVGWTLSWGSASKSISLLENTLTQASIDIKNVKSAIIGSGIIGLTVAATLICKGVDPKNITIYTKTKTVEATASYGSGAIFSCLLKSDNSAKDIAHLIVDTYTQWKLIKENSNKLNKKFAFEKISPFVKELYFYSGNEKDSGLIETAHGLEAVIEAGIIEKEKDVVLQFKQTGKSHKVKKIKSFYFNPFPLLTAFIKTLEESGINFVESTIVGEDGIKSIPENFIFNCTGSGASQVFSGWHMNNDGTPKSYPIAGHVVHINCKDNQSDLEYVILSNYKESKDSPKEYFYYMPKEGQSFTGVLGGTYLPNYDGSNKILNNDEFTKVIKRAKAVFGYSKLPKF